MLSGPRAPGTPAAGGILDDIDHVGIAVVDLEAAVGFYLDAFGAVPAHRERIETDGVEEALVPVGGSFVQLLAPTRDSSPVARFIERRGEGLHHVGYRVADCRGALSHLAARGYRLVDLEPRPGSRGTTVAFLHPASALSTLIELVQDGR